MENDGERPQPSNAPVDDEVESTPLGEDDRVVRQENVGRSNMESSGEWPSPDADPRGSAPGTSADGDEIVARRESAGAEPQAPTGTATQADLLQDGRSAGTPGPARSTEVGGDAEPIDPPERFKDVLEADPVRGGSSSIGTVET